jgi:hypothetical protein
MDTRLNVTFTPDLSLELFAQPFISSGAYVDFKEYDAPRRLSTSVYGRDVGSIEVAGSGDDRESAGSGAPAPPSFSSGRRAGATPTPSATCGWTATAAPSSPPSRRTSSW